MSIFAPPHADDTVVVLAVVGPENKSRAKQLGYTWDPVNHHGWVKRIPKGRFEAERVRAAEHKVNIIIVES